MTPPERWLPTEADLAELEEAYACAAAEVERLTAEERGLTERLRLAAEPRLLGAEGGLIAAGWHQVAERLASWRPDLLAREIRRLVERRGRGREVTIEVPDEVVLPLRRALALDSGDDWRIRGWPLAGLVRVRIGDRAYLGGPGIRLELLDRFARRELRRGADPLELVGRLGRMRPVAWLPVGEIRRVDAATVRVRGLEVVVGAVCTLWLGAGRCVRAEVVGEHDGELVLLPFEGTRGLRTGLPVHVEVAYGEEVPPFAPGHAYDAHGQRLDPLPEDGEPTPIPRGPLELGAAPVERRLVMGIPVLDLFTPLGKGQRLGIFAPPGVGKSTLLGQLVRGAEVDEVVLALVGERRRELAEFLDPRGGLVGDPRYTIVASTAADPPALQIQALERALRYAIARARLGKDVLLLVDSLTRAAQALRAAALVAGDVPVRRGYPASLPRAFARWLESASDDPEAGSLTIVCTVLTEGERLADDPVAEVAQAILDGHVWLDPRLAELGWYPAVAIQRSLSRVADRVQGERERRVARELRRAWARYWEAEDLFALGAYTPGADPELDRAIRIVERLRTFLAQAPGEVRPWRESWHELCEMFDELLTDTEAADART